MSEIYSNILKESSEKILESAYHKFFKDSLAKFGVKSPMQLDKDKRKEFFEYISKNWKSKKNS